MMMKVGGSGSFPYYPNNDRMSLVDPHYTCTKQTFHNLGGHRYVEYKHGDSPYDYQPGESDALARSRRHHIQRAMKHVWDAYVQYAFGMDELLPISKRGTNGWGGIAITLVDSLDTLWLMNMTEEFQQARDWVAHHLRHDQPVKVSVFETTIRSLGGLLAAYDWSHDDIFLQQAKDLGQRLFKSFSNPLGIPYGQVDLATGMTNNIPWLGDHAIVAEFGTLQLEFRLLTKLTGIADFKVGSERIYDILYDMANPDGLYPTYMKNTKTSTLKFGNEKYTFGAMGDSLYEYMLKLWIQGGKTEPRYREMYDKAIQGMHDELLQLSTPSGLVFLADRNNGVLDTKMDHLVCFMGGLLALGAYTDPLGLTSERAQRDLKTGKVRWKWIYLDRFLTFCPCSQGVYVVCCMLCFSFFNFNFWAGLVRSWLDFMAPIYRP